MDNENQAAMSDEALEAALLATDAIEETPEPVDQAEPEQAEGANDAEPPADQQQDDASQQTEQQQASDWNPEGPGDIKAALKHEREQAKALKQRLAEYEQREQQAQQQQMQAQYEANEQARLAQRTQMLADVAFDEERTAQLLAQFANEDRYFAQRDADVRREQEKYADGFALGRKVYPDFDAVMGKALADPKTARVLEAVAREATAAGENPVLAAYEEAKQRDPDAQAAAIQAEVARQVQAVLQKNQPPQSKGHTTIAHASGGAPSGAVDKAPHQMSDAELEAKLKG